MTLQPPPFHLGLTGHPLGHSLSPQIHAAALQSCGLRGDYSLFPIHPGDQTALAALLNRLRNGELHGLNVTIPHKQSVLPLLDELSATARAIGAVNTLSLREGRLVGDNTDAPGFLADLKNFLNGRKSKVESRKSALVLGAGGSARAVVSALLQDGWKVTLAARRREQAEELCNNLLPACSQSTIIEHNVITQSVTTQNLIKQSVIKQNLIKQSVTTQNLIRQSVIKQNLIKQSGIVETRVASLPEIERKARNAEQTTLETIALENARAWRGDLLVNTTPLGMAPNTEATPWEWPFPENVAVYDLVYNPRETRLVREARVAGLSAVSGLGMLLEQAALAFELWTGCRPPGNLPQDLG